MDARVEFPLKAVGTAPGYKLPNPALCCAALGSVLLLFQLFVLGRWVAGANFVPTEPGPDKIPPAELLTMHLFETIVPAAALFMLWKMLFQPWLRQRHLTTTGRVIIAAAMVFFWDMSVNYSSIGLFYNSYLINFGCWANGAWPSWISPSGHLLPEPIVFIMPAYLVLVFGQAVLLCAGLGKLKQRFPGMGLFTTVLLLVVGLTITDTIVESLVLRAGLYAYPGGISGLTLWAGKTYQFPMTEGFFFGGFGVAATAAIYYFRDAAGHSFVEYGADRLRVSPFIGSWVRTLAIYGFVHTVFLVLYFVPMQWVSLHADAFPSGYPSYMTNGMCVYGVAGNQCPGPGIMMPHAPAGL